MRVSVVVPTYCRPALLDRCLRALLAQDYVRTGYEIVVADDAASPETERLVLDRAAHAAVPVRYVALSPPRRGPATARNVGWRMASGDVVAFTDDDCIPDPRWLSAGVATFEADVVAATGQVIVPLPPRPTDYERDAAGLELAEFVTANCFCRRTALEAIGGFDERFKTAWREDSDLHFALLEHGGRIVRAPGARVVHPVRPAAWGISLKQQRKSLFNALLFKKHPALYRERVQSNPPWGYYASVAALAVAIGSGLRGLKAEALVASLVWAALTARFCARRLARTSLTPGHVAEMAITSVLIPPLSVFWRVCGALRFRVLFL